MLQPSVSRRANTAPANEPGVQPPRSRSRMHCRSVRSRALADARANAMPLHTPTVPFSMAAHSVSHCATVIPVIGAVPNAAVCSTLSTRLWLRASALRSHSRRPECTVALISRSTLLICGFSAASWSRYAICAASASFASLAYCSSSVSGTVLVGPLEPPRRTCRCSSAALSSASGPWPFGGGGGGDGEMAPKHLSARTRSLAMLRT